MRYEDFGHGGNGCMPYICGIALSNLPGIAFVVKVRIHHASECAHSQLNALIVEQSLDYPLLTNLKQAPLIRPAAHTRHNASSSDSVFVLVPEFSKLRFLPAWLETVPWNQLLE